MIAAFTNQVSGEPGAAHWSPTRASTPACTTRPTQSPEPPAAWRWRRWPSPRCGASGAGGLADGTGEQAGDHAKRVTTHHTSHNDHQAVNLFPFTRHTPNGQHLAHTTLPRGRLPDRSAAALPRLEIVPAKFKKRAAILEDCRTLDATLFPPKELKRMRLQLVQRAPAASVQ